MFSVISAEDVRLLILFFCFPISRISQKMRISFGGQRNHRGISDSFLCGNSQKRSELLQN